MSRAELSRNSGVPVRTLEDWESGRRNPTDINIIMEVARSLKTELRELYTDEYLKSLNAQALVDKDRFADCEECEMVLINKIDNIYAKQGQTGLAKLIDRFIYHVGVSDALKIVEEYINESSID